MADMKYVSTISPTGTPLANNTGVGLQLVMWNLHLPSYLYREIPTAFEVAGVMLNVAMIIYFIKSKKYQTPLFTILTSLAAMDTCVCLGGVMHLFIIPSVISHDVGFICGIAVFVVALGMAGSEYHLIFFACLRLYQVMNPLKARASVTVGLMAKYCATIVLLSVFSSLMYAIYWRSLTTVINGEEVTVCIFIGNTHYKEIAFLVFLTIIPCGVIFIIHVLKYFVYIRSKKLVESQQERKSPDARIIVIVITLFYICWVPALAYRIVQKMRIANYEFIRDRLYSILMHIIFANSIMNPLVYVLAMKSIREDVIQFFRCTRQKQ